MPHPFFTVGHARHTIPEFVRLLRAGNVERLIDVRTMPRSRANPQFNTDTLPAALAPYNIGYEHMPALGGLRPRSRDVSPDVNGFWENGSFHNYADYALSPEFRQGLEALIARGRQERCAVMCAESVWWRCHRRIIADYLLARGEAVFHLMDKEKVEPATLTPGAAPQKDGTVLYPHENLTLGF
jgi:uncharacterized protein (DUF488 family)